jgi:hypothetical protein
MDRETLMWFHDSWLGVVTRDSSWLFTAGLTAHFVGICLVVGSMLVVDLRLMGFLRGFAIGSTFKLLPFAIGGFLLNAATAYMFFCFDPVGYWQNPAFRVKLVLLVLAGLNALAFTLLEHRKLAVTGPDYQTNMTTKLFAGLSLFLWFAIILFGRLIVAFQGSPDLFA